MPILGYVASVIDTSDTYISALAYILDTVISHKNDMCTVMSKTQLESF